MIREYYTGCRPGDNREPIVLGTKGALLPPRHDLVAYDCPFAWGNESHGALALALAVLSDWAGDDLAKRHHVAFAWDVLARIEPADFELSAQRIQDWLEDRIGASRSATAAWQRLSSIGGGARPTGPGRPSRPGP